MPSSRQTPLYGGFSALGLSDTLVAAVTAPSVTKETTPVQRETIPLILDGGDLLAQAATGTGKTAAFYPADARAPGHASRGDGRRRPEASCKPPSPPTRRRGALPGCTTSVRGLRLGRKRATGRTGQVGGLVLVPSNT